MENKQKGFTLVEIMVVVVIIGVLAAIAIPMQADHQKKARRAIAKSTMMNIQSKEENYFLDYKTYVSDLTLIRYPAAVVNIDDNGAFVAQADAFYTISVSMLLDSISYTITAQPINRQAKDTCGTLTLDNFGNKQPASCW